MTVRPEDLLVLAEVARSGSLARAAEFLGVDHSTVSRRLDALDKHMGRPTVIRTSSGTRLTELGTALLSTASRIEDALEEANALAAGPNHARSVQGLLRVSCVDGFGTKFVTPALARLQRRHPRLQVELITGIRPFTQQAAADIEISVGRPNRRRTHNRRITAYQLACYASKDYLATHRTPTTIEELTEHRFVYYVESMLAVEQLVIIDRLLPDASISFASPNLFAQLAATTAGAGIGLLPRFMALGHHELVRLLPGVFTVQREFWASVVDRPATRPAARAFLRSLFDEVDERQGELRYPEDQ